MCINCDLSNSDAKTYPFLDQDCVTCNSTACQLCRQGFYYNTQGSYLYAANGGNVTGKRKGQCMFDTCAVGQCRNTDTSMCSTANARMKQCLRCNESSGDQMCSQCKAGYVPSPDKRDCIALSQTKTYNMFVKSTNALHRLDSN